VKLALLNAFKQRLPQPAGGWRFFFARFNERGEVMLNFLFRWLLVIIFQNIFRRPRGKF